MTATLRTTGFVVLALLPVGIGSARGQHMEPPRFEQTEPPRVVPPPQPAPRREPAPAPAPPAGEQAPPAPATPPRQPPSSTQWRPAPPAPPRREQAPPASAPPPAGEQAPPAPVPPPRQPPSSVQAPPAREQAPPARVQAPPPSSARPDADDANDDPKMWRRLGPRLSVPPPPAPAVSPPPAQAPPRPRATARSAPAPAPEPSPPPPVSAPAAAAEADQTTLVRPYTPAREPTFEPTLPRLKFGLRRFDFVRVGASNTPDGVAAPQTFNSFSIDVYPVSRVVRIGLTSAFGWESGTFLTNGDYFATQTVSLGVQYRDFGRVVPFAEAFTGVGYMRRVQFDRAIPTAFWNFGLDAGVEVYVARVGYLSLALGYMRPINGFARRQIFTSVFVDTWSLKIGIGI